MISSGMSTLPRYRRSSAFESQMSLMMMASVTVSAESAVVSLEYSYCRSTCRPGDSWRPLGGARAGEGCGLAGGTRLTYDFAKSVHRPVLLIALGQPSSAESLASWITQHQIGVLNIAGPREGSESGIFEEVKIVLTELLHEGDA